ncbi:MAG: ABC transporter ATP-binding protein [Acidimicrobiales bacterium]|jgi:ABC-2 type transport system ATP-binding protein
MRWGLQAASVRFGSRTVLEEVTLYAKPSTVTVVVGGDGAGKSTCLKALVGLVRLSGGAVQRPPKNETGYVPARAGLYPDLTVAENVEFIARAYGVTRGGLETRSSEMLERLGLAGLAERLGGHLSGGMQRKLSVGLALFHEPALLVLDEPTTGVDPVSRTELWRLISGAAASGTAVVVSTTYVNEAQRASTVTLLDEGRSIATGKPEEIVAALPGSLGVVRSGARPEGLSWRWGRTWRVWAPSSRLPEGAEPLQPEFEDAVVIAALASEQRA